MSDRMVRLQVCSDIPIAVVSSEAKSAPRHTRIEINEEKSSSYRCKCEKLMTRTSKANGTSYSGFKTAPAFAYHPRLKRVDDFVSQHIADPIKLKDAARVAALEPKYFSKYFSQKAGITFTQWLHDKRIERAKKLLARESISIQRLAALSGYSNPRTFRRAFRIRTGLSPSAYRNEVRSQLRKRLPEKG